LTDKFNSLAADAIADEGRRSMVAATVRRLDEVSDLGELGDLLRGSGRS